MNAAPKPAPRVRKSKNPPIDKEAYLQFRQSKGWSLFCDSGIVLAQGTDMHHAFIGRKKGYPILDDYRNIVLVNHWDHINRVFDCRYWKSKFWALNVSRYGYAEMHDWANKVVEAGLSRDRLDFLR